MRFFILTIALAITTAGSGQDFASPVRLRNFQEIGTPNGSPDLDRMIDAIELLTAKFEQLQTQVNAQAAGRNEAHRAPLVDQFCPGCQSQLSQLHNATSGPTHSPTSFGNIPVIDTNGNMQNAIPRVIFVEGRPQLILDPEPVSFLEKFLSLRRR